MSVSEEKKTDISPHIPVLLPQVLKSFEHLHEGTLIDCTLGYAGHSFALLEAHPKLRLIGIDRDPEALAFSRERLRPFGGRIRLMQGSFSRLLPHLLQEEDAVAGILADFGVSSLQLDKKERGFSFESDSLDMRMDPQAPLNAFEVVNRYPAQQLERIFRDYGEIPQAAALARAAGRGATARSATGRSATARSAPLSRRRAATAGAHAFVLTAGDRHQRAHYDYPD